MVLDNLGVHKSGKAIDDFKTEFEGQLILHYTPTYSSPLNMIEMTWSHLK